MTDRGKSLNSPRLYVCWRTDVSRLWAHIHATVPYHAATEMMSQDRHSLYRGLAVTVTWKELQTLSPSGRTFVAGYAVATNDGAQGPWHDLPNRFHSFSTAARHALSQARMSIDASLAI